MVKLTVRPKITATKNICMQICLQLEGCGYIHRFKFILSKSVQFTFLYMSQRNKDVIWKTTYKVSFPQTGHGHIIKYM